MTAADLDGVVRIARASFPDHFEDRSCFAERLMLYPQGCFILAAEGVVAGYLIAYPWMSGSAPPLNSLIHQLPACADLIYLHDLALHPDARGRGYTQTVVHSLVAQARSDGWCQIALVAVNRATAFWQKMGFSVVEKPTELKSYGDNSAYMMRRILAEKPATR